MGPDEQTTSDMEADAFFASFINAPADVIARVAAEGDTHTGPDLDAIVAEVAGFNYWGRRQEAREARRAAVDASERIRWGRTWGWRAGANEEARLPPLPPESLALLPAPRIVRLTNEERAQTLHYWSWLRTLTTGRNLIVSLRREAAGEPGDGSAAARAWRRSEREFERTEWEQTRDARAGAWRRRKAELAWVAISEDRALEIALAAFDKTHRPQAD